MLTDHLFCGFLLGRIIPELVSILGEIYLKKIAGIHSLTKNDRYPSAQNLDQL